MNKDYTLNNSCQKLLKAVHIILAASVLGGLISILSLLLLKQTKNFQGNTFPIDLGILKIFTWAVNYAFLILLITAFVYSLFTEWGFVKYRWITLKWFLVLIIFAMTWVGFGPSINGMTSISDIGLNNSVMKSEYLNFQNKALIYTSIELCIMILIALISIFKPFGKREIKHPVKQKTIIMIVLPIFIIGIGFVAVSDINLNKIRHMPIENVNLSKINDGTYKGKADVGNSIYKVEVKVVNHKIVNIKSIDNRKSPYVTYAEGVFPKIIKEQKINVDAVTGATTTSKAFMKSVENALK
ncbi:FMN-binding protein [Clostridium carboxidivorans P7]|uniref:FMN-binding domain protein n=1 Tax=Clostridium carboxidivorans P7 TaxID=536227 RepID=C6PU81_9CLOT|nr:FMN-binding protein [Clostridium carboxidivorans]AKN31375.1 FMN-binding protein [Clostridium carboxidivorans P7]EET87179.1 FMN-binding domain protein [Clostridium carboxidivorans P7]EFG87233.1 hypothetical protein CLCAR_3342 [Clostridium carboxidivorans P7]